ncbi:polysaccharide deacetylase family protein [Fusibacter bizertensis]
MNRQIFKIIIFLIVVMTISTGFKAIQINSSQKLELNEYKSKVDNQETQIKALKNVEAIIKEKDEQINALKRAQSEMNQTILDLNQNIVTLNNQIASLTDKVVYLTFDDGPSKETTLEILKVLNKYSVKATFFVIGRNVVKNPTVLKEIRDQGHAIGNHSFSHNYTMIYKDEDSFWTDYNKCQDAIYAVTGEYPELFRFPGGSNTATNFRGDDFVSQLRINLLNQGVQFFDWNIESGDASTNYAEVGTIKSNAYTQISKKKYAIVLFHDSDNKKSTVEALPEIIEYYLTLGYRFDVLTPSGFTTQFK